MTNLYIETIRRALGGAFTFFAIIFLPAWTLDYWQGWVYFVAFATCTTLMTIYMAIYDKELLERRLRVGPTAEKTRAQKIIMGLAIPIFVASVVIPVLDHRFGWSPEVPAYISLIADACIVVSFWIIFLVMKENSYAASTIEVDQNQHVISTGPYAIVRHPMYAGALPLLIMTPLALGSWWGLLFIPLFIMVLLWRLFDEERFLHLNLPGYTAYTQTVRYRLIPGIF
jgi:protein-S-isoprenylcysteine O-methyltransferase Ste14